MHIEQIPTDSEQVGTTGELTPDTMPPGLRRQHQLPPRTYGLLQVSAGAVEFHYEGEPAQLATPETPVVIEPGSPHAVAASEDARFRVDFYRSASG